MTRVRVIGFGALNIDELYRVQSVLLDDETPIKQHKTAPGGSAANTIYGLAKLGIDTGFVGTVGSDKAGRLLLQEFKSIGTDCSQIKIKKRTETGSVLGLTDSYGKRALYVAPGANSLLRKADLSSDYFAQAELIHLSSFVDDRQFELQKWVVSNLPPHVKISFTPGAIYTRKGLTALEPILSKIAILFANESEIEELTGTQFRAAARYFLNKGCQIVVITLGKKEYQPISKSQLTLEFTEEKAISVHRINTRVANGNETKWYLFRSYVADTNNEYFIETWAEYGKDTTGAGDAFAAGFLYGLLSDKNLEECGHLGEIVAQFSISKIGAREGLPTLTELSQRYQELYQQEL